MGKYTLSTILFYIVAVFLFLGELQAQEREYLPPPPPPPPPETWVEDTLKGKSMQMSLRPRLPGCEDEPNAQKQWECSDEKLKIFLSKRISYPVRALEKGISGTVRATYVVSKNGRVDTIKIVEDIGGGCGAAVQAALQSLAEVRFQPMGNMSGRLRPLAVQFELSVQFVGGRVKIGN